MGGFNDCVLNKCSVVYFFKTLLQNVFVKQLGAGKNFLLFLHVNQIDIINTYNKDVRNVEVMCSPQHDMEANFIDRDSDSTAFVGMFALARRARVSLCRETCTSIVAEQPSIV